MFVLAVGVNSVGTASVLGCYQDYRKTNEYRINVHVYSFNQLIDTDRLQCLASGTHTNYLKTNKLYGFY